MKYALIIGNNKYNDPKLAQLKTPAADSQALAKVLDDKTIGSFDEVTPLINQTETRIRRAISTFLTNKKPDDLVLLYFSGHGVLDDRGRLYLALRDTQVNLLKATSIPSSFVADEMDSCRSKRQILVLDCCHSGAFGRGTKGEQKAVTETTFEGSGFGRVVLTASDSTQYALEGDQVIRQTELSLFTHFLLEGLNTGAADTNNDGHISLDEWYDYTYAKVISETPRQVPHKWSYNQQGDLIIAKNPYVKKRVVELPYELMQALESQFVSIRESAVTELGKYLRSREPEMVDLAIAALEKMKGDDSRRISLLAERLLSEFEQSRAPAIKVTPSKTTAEMETEAARVMSTEVVTPPKKDAEIESLKERPRPQPKVEKEHIPVDHPLPAQGPVLTPLFWLKWIGATFIGTVILDRLGTYLYENELFKSIPILFGILAGLVSLIQWSIIQNRVGRWWIAANVAAGIFLGLLNDLISNSGGPWLKDAFVTFWFIGNLVLASILIGKRRETDSLSPDSTIESIETGARQNSLFILLSIYLGLAALPSFIVVSYETSLPDISDSLKEPTFTLYAIVGIVVGVSFIRKKEMLGSFGFIALAAFSFLDGIYAGIYAFKGYYPLDVIFPLLGIISLSSGVFFISQQEIWTNKNIGFMALIGYLMAISLAYFGIMHTTFLMISGIFALIAAGFFFLRK